MGVVAFLIITVLWSPGRQALMATKAKQSRGILCVDCAHPQASAMQLGAGKVRRVCLLLLARQWENALAMRSCQLQQGSRKVLCLYVPTSSFISEGWYRLYPLSLQSRRMPRPLSPTGLSKAVRVCCIHVCLTALAPFLERVPTVPCHSGSWF